MRDRAGDVHRDARRAAAGRGDAVVVRRRRAGCGPGGARRPATRSLDAAPGRASAADPDAVPDRLRPPRPRRSAPRLRTARPIASRAHDRASARRCRAAGRRTSPRGTVRARSVGSVRSPCAAPGALGVVERPVPELLLVGHDPHLRARAVKPEEVRGKAADRSPTRRTYQPRPAGGRVMCAAALADDEVHEPAGHDHDPAHGGTVEQRGDASRRRAPRLRARCRRRRTRRARGRAPCRSPARGSRLRRRRAARGRAPGTTRTRSSTS